MAPRSPDGVQEIPRHWRARSKRHFKFLYSVVVCSLIFLGSGATNVFSSPLLDEMIRDANSTPWLEGFHSCSYQSFIAPSMAIGAIPGSFLGALMSAILGLHTTILLGAVWYAVSWGMIGASWFMPTPVLFRTLILVGRFFTGVCFGLTSSILSVYGGEISPSSSYRAFFIGMLYVFYAIGTTVTYAQGAFLPYWIIAFICCGSLIATVVMAMFLPESPLRTRNVAVNVKKFVASVQSKVIEGKSYKMILSGSFLKRLGVVCLLFSSHVFMGYAPLIQYVGPILNVAGAQDWNVPHGVLVAATVGGGDLVGSILAIIISPRIKHVFSAFIGAAGITVGHIAIAVYFFLVEGFSMNELSTDVSLANTTSNTTSGLVCFFEPAVSGELGQLYSPLALIGIAVVMLMYGIFWMIQPFVIAVEIFTDEQRIIGTGIALALRSVQQAAVSFIFPYATQAIGTAMLFVVFAVSSALTAIFLPCLVPETKGRPMGERGGEFTPKQNLKEFLETFKSYCCFSCRKCSAWNNDKK